MARQIKRRFRPPIGIATEYASLLRSWIDRGLERLLARLREHWRHDTRVTRPLAWIDIALEEALDPAAIAPHLEKFAKRISIRGKDEFRRVIGIPTTDLGIPVLVKQFRDRNVDLIKSLAGQQKTKIKSMLEAADQDAIRVEVLSKDLISEFGVTKSKANLLARDQVLKLNGQITQSRQVNAGITKYIWRTSGDERVRESHVALDGTTQSWDNPPVISDDGRTGHPGDDYQCRCTADPILPEFEDL